MRMRPKSPPRRHAIIIDHPQRPEPPVRPIEVLAKRKRMPTRQPVNLRLTPSLGTANQHDAITFWQPVDDVLNDKSKCATGFASASSLAKDADWQSQWNTGLHSGAIVPQDA
jgi:hypothetical protein